MEYKNNYSFNTKYGAITGMIGGIAISFFGRSYLSECSDLEKILTMGAYTLVTIFSGAIGGYFFQQFKKYENKSSKEE